MTCRHKKGDPDCGSTRPQRYSPPPPKPREPPTPDAGNFDIEDCEQVGSCFVVKAKYPNCAKCAFEGTKILVFKGVTMKQALKWRRLDPHFRASVASPTEAPSPIARFPGTKEGWQDALYYSKWKSDATSRD
jgi:hypothetical protein